MHSSRLNFFVRHDLPRSSPISSLDRTKSLHDPAPIPSCYDFRTVSALYTRYSTSLCWNQQLQTQFPIEFNPHLRQLQSMMNPNSKFPKSSIPRLTTDVVPANSFTLSAGLVTKALTKKPLGSLHPNSDMLRNLSRIFTWHTLPNPALCRVFIDLTSGVLHFLEITLYGQLPNPGQFRDLGIHIRPDISDSAEFSHDPSLSTRYLRISGRDP